MADLAIAIKIATEDASSGPIDKIKGALGGLTSVVTAPTRALGGLVTGLGQLGLAAQGVSAVVDGVKGIGNAFGIGALNELEQTRASFNAFTKDAAKTEEIMAMVRKEAALTPFAFGEMAKATASLMPVSKSSGIALQDLLKNAEILAASNPLEGLEGASFSLREAMTGDFTSIIERFNLSRSSINKWKEEGVPNIEIVRRAMQEMGFDSDLISAKAETLDGRWSTFQDTLVTLQTKMGQPIFDAMKEGLIGLQGALDENMGTLEGWADSVAAGFTQVIKVSKDLFDIFMGGDSFDAAAEVLDKLFPPAVVDGILDVVDNLGVAFDGLFRGDLPALLNGAKGVIEGFGDIIVGVVEDWAATFAGWVDGAGSDMLGNLADMSLGVQAWLFDTALVIAEKLGVWAAAFVDWIGPKIPDLLRELGSYLASMTGWAFGTALPMLVSKLAEWGEAFVTWIGPKIMPMLVEAGKLLGELGTWLMTRALPAIVNSLAEWGLAIVEWVAPRIPTLLLELGKLWIQVQSWMLFTALPAVVTALLEWGAAFAAWVPGALLGLLFEIGKLEVQFLLWVGTAAGKLVTALLAWGDAMTAWIAKDVLPALPNKLGEILTAMSGWVGEKATSVATLAMDLGSSFVTGIRDGISGALDGLWNWLRTEFIEKIPAFVRKILDINSPSGVFEGIGTNIVAGLRVGLEKNLPSVSDLIRNTIGNLGGEVGDSGGKVRSHIVEAAAERGIDPRAALAVARHEGGEDDYMRIGKFATGWSFWPFQLHYGGKGYEYFGTTAGMGNDFTRRTKWQPGDWRAWEDSIDFGLDHAKKHGWGAWYGRGPAGIGEWEGIKGYADGGWITEPVVGIGVSSGRGYTFRERGEDELVVPRSRLGQARPGGGDNYNFYGVQPESVFSEAERRQRQQSYLRAARRA